MASSGLLLTNHTVTAACISLKSLRLLAEGVDGHRQELDNSSHGKRNNRRENIGRYRYANRGHDNISSLIIINPNHILRPRST
jgi:hypothetical protein